MQIMNLDNNVDQNVLKAPICKSALVKLHCGRIYFRRCYIQYTTAFYSHN
jgi:hypothetical protein